MSIWKKILNHIQLVAVAVAALIFVIVFIAVISNKEGDKLYITEASGDVQYVKDQELNDPKPVKIGMQLEVTDIVITGEKSSCVLAYTKKAKTKDNYIFLGENSQVSVYNQHKDTGGYDFHLSYGTLISNMLNKEPYTTNFATPVYKISGNDSIFKLDYDSRENKGLIYVFGGNPYVQTIQKSGSLGNPDKLIKNSCCAVQLLADGTVGYGLINSDIHLNEFSAQDLKTMAGIANVRLEQLSYSAQDFEQAFLTAGDNSKWMETQATVTAIPIPETEPPVDTLTASNDTSYAETIGNMTTTSEFDGNTQTYAPSIGTTAPLTTIGGKRTTMSDYTRYSPDGTVTTVPDETSRTDRTERTTTAYSDYDDEDWEDEDDSRYTTAATTRRPDTIIIFTDAPDNVVFTDSTTRAPAETGTKPPVTTYIGPGPGNNTSTTTTTTTYSPSQSNPKPVIDTTPPAPNHKCNEYHKVIFTYSVDGVEFWALQAVKCGEDANTPKAPVVPGKIFIGWDRSYTCVRGDMEVHAMFSNDPNYSGAITTTVPVNYDYDYNDYTTAQSITDIYTTPVETPVQDYYTVTFYVNNQIWEVVTVKRGETAVPSKLPVSPDMNSYFSGWSEDVSNVQHDMIVFAMFTTL